MKKKMKGFIKGMGSVFNISSIRQHPEVKKILGQTDSDAIKNDWNQVGYDINCVIEKYKKDIKENRNEKQRDIM